jgi:hypothetical protein
MGIEHKNNIFEPIFKVLATGNRGEVKEAKKQLDKLWRSDHKLFMKSGSFVLEIIHNFDNIPDAEHKADVISGLGLFYLALANKYFEELKDFIVKNLQHPDGRVREAARKTGDWIYYSLTNRAEPFVYPKKKPLTEKQKVAQQIAKKQYSAFVSELESLIDLYSSVNDEMEYLEYIEDMKPSVNKSLQLMWSRFTDSSVYRKIVEQSLPIPPEILNKRQEIENQLENLLKETKSDFDLDDIKDIIYLEDGQDSLTEIIAMFDTGQGAIELQNAVEALMDAWNYFPHKSLDGYSPTEKALEAGKKQHGISADWI